jgi:DNA-binding transcriptional LysR family regulator
MARFDWHVRADLKPRHLQLLVALDDFRSLVKVADYLHITQPAVSKALAELERGLEVQLFERGPRGMTPTLFGECMIRHARTLLGDFRKAHDELASLRSGGGGIVSLGILPAAAPVLAPMAIALLKRRSPETTVTLSEGTLDNLLPDLQVGRLDLVVGTLAPTRLPSTVTARILHEEDPLVLVAGAHHPLASRPNPRWADLADYPWIVPPPGASMREPLERILAEHDLPIPLNRVESVSLVTNWTLLRHTLCIGFFSKHIAQHYEELGLIRMLPLEIPKLVGPVGAMWIREKPLLPATQAMLNALTEVAADPATAAAAGGVSEPRVPSPWGG